MFFVMNLINVKINSRWFQLDSSSQYKVLREVWNSNKRSLVKRGLILFSTHVTQRLNYCVVIYQTYKSLRHIAISHLK